MKSIFLVLALGLMNPALHAAERSPFTNIGFGLILGWGNFIKVENPDFITSDKTHYLIELNGRDYKDILKQTKSLYGDKHKCQLAEHFVETMAAIGIKVGETVDMKLYVFDGGHELLDLKDVPVTEENLEELQFETNFCE